MKKVELLFNVKVEGSEMKVTSFVESVVEASTTQGCSVIDKHTLSDGSFNIVLTGMFNEIPANKYEQISLVALEYCKEMWICDMFIATALRHIIEKLYAMKYLSIDEYSNVWSALLDLCNTTGVNLLPYKIYGIQSGIYSKVLTRFMYVPTSCLHLPVCKDEKIIAYLEYDEENRVVVRISDKESVEENIISKVRDILPSAK